MRGEAAEFAFSQLGGDVLKSYDLLEQALATRYREQRTLASYLAELESRKLGQKEKLAEYASDIKGLVLKSFPTADSNTRETINLRYFFKGLGDQQMAVAVGMKDPKTIEEARITLETYRSLQDEIGKGSKVRNVGYGNKKRTIFAARNMSQRMTLRSFYTS